MRDTRFKANSLKSLPNSVQVRTESALLEAFATDASGRQGSVPLAVVNPRTVEDVQAIVRWSMRHSTPLVPVSSPQGPRGRGDTVNDRACVVIDLSGMDRVMHVDARDAIAIIEPGVTFPVFNLLLAEHRLRTFQPLCPRASKSVLTAFLEREPMTMPAKHWDVADPLASMELVFGTGDRFRTGSAAMPGTLEDNLARGNRQLVAPGPSFTDFGRVIQGSQGALGVVVWASILCERIPAVEVPLLATGDDLGAIIGLCYRMLRRRPAGQLFILNNVQLALLLADDAPGFDRLKRLLPQWTLYVELSATSYFPEEAIAYQRADLERDAAALDVRISSDIAGHEATAVPRRQRAFSDVPLHGRAGLIAQEVFCLAQLDAALAQNQAVAKLTADHVDLAIYLQPAAQGVNAHMQFTIIDKPGREAALSRSAIAVAETLADHRGFLSRPYHPWAQVPFDRDPGIKPMLARVKSMFDPNNILQPDALSMGAVR